MIKLLAVTTFLLTSSFYAHTTPAIAAYAPQDNTLAVLGFTAKGNVTTAEASIIEDRLRTLLVQTGSYQMIERGSIQQILKEQGFQSAQVCDETNCSVEIGRILAVKKVVVKI
jgi:curli biogenesis system outer membrane secretion channel CsgG